MSSHDLEEEDQVSSDDEVIEPSSPVEPPTEPTLPASKNEIQAEVDPPPPTLQPPASQPLVHTVSEPPANTIRLPDEPARPTFTNRTSTSGLARFKAASRTVMQARALTTRGVGAEPGIDVRKGSAAMLYGHIHQKCEIEVIDFGEKHATFKLMDNEAFKIWSDSPGSRRKANVQVRWINVGGLSWDVVSQLGLKYGMSASLFFKLAHSLIYTLQTYIHSLSKTC